MDKGKAGHIAANYLKGRLKVAEFAVTNCCIAKCSFCDIWKQTPKIFTDKAKALAAIDKLADFGVSHMTLTGGEPLMHPDVIELVRRASRRKINNAILVAAPGLLLRNDNVGRLEAAGCDLICISFDSGDPEVMAKSRQIENIMGDMEGALNAISKTRLKTMASVLIWNDNRGDIEEVCKSAENMGFSVVALNYPTFSESSVYTLGGEGVMMSREDVIKAIEEAIRLRKSNKYRIMNTVASMRNIVDFLKDPKSARHPCFGGRRVLFVDWFCNAHPCMQLENSLGNMADITEADLNAAPCNKCNMSWYRDFSLFFNGMKSIPVLIESILSTGKFL